MKLEEMITEARTWVKTPYLDQARKKGVGCDCIGFPVGLFTSFGIDLSEVPVNYHRTPNPTWLLSYLDSCEYIERDELELLEPGRLALFTMYKEPQHFGVIVGPDTMIHCLEDLGVVETPIGIWGERRLHSVWRLRFLE